MIAMHSNNELVQFIEQEMRRLGYNQSMLAKRAGLSRQTISNMFAGRRIPDPLTCEKLANALECKPQVLWRLAGHDVPDEEEQTLKDSLRRAITPYLPEDASAQVVERMVTKSLEAIRETRFEYGIVLDDDLEWARARIEERDVNYRAIDPRSSRVLTAIFQSGRAFCVSGQLNSAGDEVHRERVRDTVWRGAEWMKLEGEYSVQMWPITRGSAGSEDDPVSIHFWIPEDGDQELAWRFRLVRPNGQDEECRDNLAYAMQLQAAQKIRTALPSWDRAIGEDEQTHAKQVKKVQDTIISTGKAFRKPIDIAINPDTLSYLMLLAYIPEAHIYWILEGKLDELNTPVWATEMATRSQCHHEMMGGRWENLLHLGGYCLHVLRGVTSLPPHWTSVRHRSGEHLVLHWQNRESRSFAVANPFLGTWRVWQISKSRGEFLGLRQTDEEVRPGNLERRSGKIKAVAEQRVQGLREKGINYEILYEPREWGTWNP